MSRKKKRARAFTQEASPLALTPRGSAETSPVEAPPHPLVEAPPRPLGVLAQVSPSLPIENSSKAFAHEALDTAIRENHRLEISSLLVALLFAVAALTLLVYGAIQGSSLLAFAGLLLFAMSWPGLRAAARIRRQNIAIRLLQIPLDQAESSQEAAEIIKTVLPMFSQGDTDLLRVTPVEETIEEETGWPDPAEAAALRKEIDQLLAEVMGPSYSTARVEWGRGKDETGRPLFILSLSSGQDSAVVKIPPGELRSPTKRKIRVLQLWGDILRARTDRSLSALTRVGD